MASEKTVLLRSSDGEEFTVEEAVAVKSQTIKTMIEEDDCDCCVFPVPNVDGNTPAKVLDEDTDAAALPSATMKKERKRGTNTVEPSNPPSSQGEDGVSADVKSTKQVRFSMKNNLVWKPHSPLPPQSLRLPPSVTPRGSALKKGVPPGPIKVMPPATKKVKQKKKGRKILRSISSAMKRLKNVKTQVLSV